MWVFLKKVRSDMRRANLLSAAVILAFTISSSQLTNAQMYPQGPYGPPASGGHPHLLQMPQSPQRGCPPPIVDHYVQHSDSVWDEDRPIEKFLSDVSRRSWLRLEFMMWDYERPGDSTIGAPVTGVQDINQSFDTVNRRDPTEIPAGQVLIPTMTTLNLRDNPGMRGTLGVAMNGGSLELSFFGFEQASDSFIKNNLQQFRLQGLESIGTQFIPNYAVPLLNNGAVSDAATMNSFVFDDSFQSRIETQIWGTELSFLTDPYLPGDGFKWQWLGGFRYLNMDEQFRVMGIYNNGGTAPNQVTRINSSTVNNIYGPQAGGRASIVNRRLTLSFTPRVMLGLNDFTAQTNYTDRSGAVSRSVEEQVDFSVITQLSFTGEIAVNSYCSLFAGYDFMWLPSVARPQDNVVYNSTPAFGGGFNADIRQNVDKQNFFANGFSFGLQLKY
jgi:Putative beta barrel porin-7 (BBP7)